MTEIQTQTDVQTRLKSWIGGEGKVGQNFLSQCKAALKGTNVNLDYFQSCMLSAVKDPSLLECDPVSILLAGIEAARYGLVVDGVLGHAYLVPHWNKRKGRKEATFIPGYKGLIQIAYKGGKVVAINGHVVFDGDEFEVEYGLNESLTHKPKFKTRAILGAYTTAETNTGRKIFRYMPIEDIEKIRQKSPGKDSPAWTGSYDAMCIKTTMRALFRWLPVSDDAIRLASRGEDGDDPREVEAEVLTGDPEPVEIGSPPSSPKNQLSAVQARFEEREAEAEIVETLEASQGPQDDSEDDSDSEDGPKRQRAPRRLTGAQREALEKIASKGPEYTEWVEGWVDHYQRDSIGDLLQTEATEILKQDRGD